MGVLVRGAKPPFDPHLGGCFDYAPFDPHLGGCFDYAPFDPHLGGCFDYAQFDPSFKGVIFRPCLCLLKEGFKGISKDEASPPFL
jgi:hypothetical protein